ncbi:unnamed protein product [Cylicostephanus goldi]|uniref:Uncharacterized protein n=1 Tax=Cylicostephanus goldi TaxID=71465 RepID=A0A3P7P167_CYLGO|nr:unnamed protein product [Cylicostephanus goldi]
MVANSKANQSDVIALKLKNAYPEVCKNGLRLCTKEKAEQTCRPLDINYSASNSKPTGSFNSMCEKGKWEVENMRRLRN